jgi:hypothetical protein
MGLLYEPNADDEEIRPMAEAGALRVNLLTAEYGNGSTGDLNPTVLVSFARRKSAPKVSGDGTPD